MKQEPIQEEEIKKAPASEGEELTVKDMIKDLPNGYLSDLKVDDIPDSAVSDTDIGEEKKPEL
jgi:hypothetical protein